MQDRPLMPKHIARSDAHLFLCVVTCTSSRSSSSSSSFLCTAPSARSAFDASPARPGGVHEDSPVAALTQYGSPVEVLADCHSREEGGADMEEVRGLSLVLIGSICLSV